ncbi:MAG TPA: N-6 DNA methylase, partial [Polyangium sp.]|nr:N-6 DNA methylase [Polyangium sp.]
MPRISDGVIYRVLDRLLVLDGERLQYKGLDVEQIGSVYEGLMGFELRVAEGDSVCLLPEHVVVDLDALLKKPGAERLKELKAQANLDVKDKSSGEVKDAKTVDALFGALGKRVSPRQPGLLPRGSLVLQPGEERRRTGSHYTPRSLTLPIVETTLRPVLERLGPDVRPEQLLALKVCDPAMGSGAFLVEACRQLADKLVDAWRRTKTMPDLPRDEDPVLHARRLIAQQCIYGVDKNPLAVDLARLSIWLVTFAKEHPFTFVDHSLRHGDSLVGLSKEQVFNLSLDPAKGAKLAPQARNQLANAVREAEELRGKIHALGDPPMTDELQDLWDRANHALRKVRMLGDLVIASFFQESSDKGRKKALEDIWVKGVAWLNNDSYEHELTGMVEDLRKGDRPVPAFHWEIEFPEVFGRANPGFDCFVGNPPFAGKNTITATSGDLYIDWLKVLHEESHGNADLVAHFFRRAFNNLRKQGTMGLIATNTIAQGDTRSTGLRWIRKHGGHIYNATRRYKWPGAAAVVVTIRHLAREWDLSAQLDGKDVPTISAFLFHGGSDEDPGPIPANGGKSFIGSTVLGMGFTFDATAPEATSIVEMQRLIKKNPRNQERIFPYIGGEELNSSPTHAHNRYVINFGQLTEDEARSWPD